MTNTNEPLIHTSKGNLPISSLEYKTGFDWMPNGCVFWEEHILDGEIVRRSAHPFILPIGSKLEIHGGSLNG